MRHRDYKKEAAYEDSPEQVRHRVMRNAARRALEQSGLVHKGDGKEVDHKNALDKGGSNARSNWQVLSRHANRVKGAK
jgi:5-methylcytosine-specific restriction endonuclease McrA